MFPTLTRRELWRYGAVTVTGGLLSRLPSRLNAAATGRVRLVLRKPVPPTDVRAVVVGQTVTIAPEWYPIGGRTYLGMDPGPRLR